MPVVLIVICCVVFPLTELFVIIQVGEVIGPWWTIGLLVAVSAIGAAIVKSEGRKAWRHLSEALSAGQVPGKELADGALLIAGGTLLLVPGFVTDVVGLLCVLPFTRPLVRSLLLTVLQRRAVAAAHGRYAPQERGGAHRIYYDDPYGR